MKKKYFVAIIFVFCNSCFLIAQQKMVNVKIDSLFLVLPKIKIDTAKVNILNEIAEEIRMQDPNKALLYCNQALQLSKKIKWNNGIALSLRNIGQNHAVLGDIEKADKYFDNALQYAKSKLNKCLLYRAKGTVNSAKGNFAKALEFYFKSLKILEEIKNDKELAKIYLVIGSTYNSSRDFKNSLFYLKKSLAINTKLNCKPQISKNMQFIAGLYNDNKKYTFSLNYCSMALKIANEIGDKDGIASVNIMMTQIHTAQEKFEEALKHNQIAKENAKEIKNHRYITTSKFDEARIYVLQSSKDSTNSKKLLLLSNAESLLKESIANYEKSNDKVNISRCYKSLVQLYLLKKNYKKAVKFSVNYALINDSIYSEKSKETIKNLEDQRTIELKNKQIEINTIILESKEKQKWLYIFVIGFLGVLGSLFFYQNQNRKKINKKLKLLNLGLEQANKTKIKFLSILNHDLRSPVYNFIHFMQLQKESPELLDKVTKDEIETKTILSAENLLASMEDLLLWSKGQMDNFTTQPTIIQIKNLFENTKNHFASEQNLQILFENPDNLEIISDENLLKTIVRNLTENAIKALHKRPNANIVWKAFVSETKTVLSITDNASGTNKDQLKALYDDTEVLGIETGLGLHLIRDLAKIIQCEITVDSKVGVGTTFTLKL